MNNGNKTKRKKRLLNLLNQLHVESFNLGKITPDILSDKDPINLEVKKIQMECMHIIHELISLFEEEDVD